MASVRRITRSYDMRTWAIDQVNDVQVCRDDTEDFFQKRSSDTRTPLVRRSRQEECAETGGECAEAREACSRSQTRSFVFYLVFASCGVPFLYQPFLRVIRPDNSYTVSVDMEEKHAGNLKDDFDFLPPKEIKVLKCFVWTIVIG